MSSTACSKIVYACVHWVLMQAALSLLSIDLAHFKKTYYLANNCVKALLLSRHVRVSTLGVFTKGLFLVLHPNIAFLQNVPNYVKLVIHRFSALSKMCHLAYNLL